MFKLIVRAVLILGLAMAVAACSYKPRGPRLANLANKVPVEQAFITPPPGGPEPIAVIEQRFSNGVLQEIILDNPTSSAGQNVLVARAFGPMGEDRGMERMSLDEPTVADIRREMRERFPGVYMNVSETYVQNRYGPFGFATGQMGGGVNCIYAWQEIRAKKSVLFPGYRGAVTWRLRVCAHATARELLYLAYGLNINVYFLADNWNIFGGDLPEPNPDIGKLGKPLGPDKVVEDLSMAPPIGWGEYRKTRSRSSRSSTTRSSRTTTRTTTDSDLANEPAVGAAVVPPPAAAQRQRSTPSTSSAVSAVPAPPSAASSAQSQPQSSSQQQIQRAPSISAPTTSQAIPRPPSQSSGGTNPAQKPAVRAPSLPAPTTSQAIPQPPSASGGSSGGSSGSTSGTTSDGVRQVGPSTTLIPAPKAPQTIR